VNQGTRMMRGKRPAGWESSKSPEPMGGGPEPTATPVRIAPVLQSPTMHQSDSMTNRAVEPGEQSRYRPGLGFGRFQIL
jgi:hypothetical protein